MIEEISELSELEFARIFTGIRDYILEDPIANFVKKKHLIDFSPTPAQSVAFKIIFGQDLDGLTKHNVYNEITGLNGEFELGQVLMTEVELYEFMTGFPYTTDQPVRNKINLIVGRRGGKSTISAIVAIFSMLKTNWKPFLTKTPVATVMVLSHSVEFSEEIIDIIRNMVEDSPILTRLKDTGRKNTQRIFHMKFPFIKKRKNGDDYIEWSRVRIKVGAASKKTTRGSAVCTLLCDEIAYWNLDEGASESDVDVLRAVRPALLQFGKQGTIIKLSSPGIKQGILYDEWVRRDIIKDDYVQFKAPSWVWNTILPAEEFAGEWRLDPDGFNTEFRANFVDSISNFILPEFVDLATMRGVAFLPPVEDTKTTYSAAIDAAFKSDRFAFAIVGHNESRVTTYVVKYWEGSRKNPVSANEVAKYIRQMCKNYGISDVIGDQHSFQPLREIFEQYGIRLIENTFSLPYKKKIYFGLKRLIHSQQMDLLDIPILTKEIKELQVEQTPTGQIRIGHPVGGSDDCVPADTLIKTEYGYRAISELKVGDQVFTHKGRLRPILKLFEKEYDTELYTVNAFGHMKLQLTGNHPLFTNKLFYGDEKQPAKYTKWEWKTPENWKKRYKISSLGSFDSAQTEQFFECPSATKCSKIDLTTPEFGLLLGYFLGDGWAIRPEKSVGNAKYKCSLAIANKDSHILHFIVKTLRSYGLSPHKAEGKGCISVNFHSKLLWSIFSRCYNDEREKILPPQYKSHKLNLLRVLQGWLLADGWKTKEYKKPHGGQGSSPHRVGSTTSKRLALELRDLSAQLGLTPSLSERKSHRYGVPCKDQYWIAFRRPRQKCFIQRNEDYITAKAKITKEPYKGKLYNIQVAEDESYVANGIIVHNCSDALAVATFNALEKAGAHGIATGEIATSESLYKVRVDKTGKAFTAPHPEMLSSYVGFKDAMDNSGEYAKDPETGKWRKRSEMEEEESLTNAGGDFIF